MRAPRPGCKAGPQKSATLIIPKVHFDDTCLENEFTKNVLPRACCCDGSLQELPFLRNHAAAPQVDADIFPPETCALPAHTQSNSAKVVWFPPRTCVLSRFNPKNQHQHIGLTSKRRQQHDVAARTPRIRKQLVFPRKPCHEFERQQGHSTICRDSAE